MISYEPPEQEAFDVGDYIDGIGKVLDPDDEVTASLMESIYRQTEQIDNSIRATTAQIARNMGEIQ